MLFALVGTASIVLLASIGTPSHQGEDIDRHTGRRIVVVRTVGDALFETRQAGDALSARARLKIHLLAFPDAAILADLDAALEAELSGIDVPPPERHAASAVIAAEQARARNRRAELKHRIGERLSRESLLALLFDLEADRAVATATEDFFAPLARWTSERPPETEPDALAAYAHRRLESLRDAADPDEPTAPNDPIQPPTPPQTPPSPPNPSPAQLPAPLENPDLLLEVARVFQAHQRPRARRRWLLRAYAAFPGSTAARDGLVAAYLGSERQVEAFLVVGSALNEEPNNRALWEHRAQIAVWLGRQHAEIEAQEALLSWDDTEERRERIITLYSIMGNTGAAVPHALVLAERDPDRASRQRVVTLALRSGDVDAALKMLDSFARESEDPAYWRDKIIHYATQDLRVGRVIMELELLRRLHPDRDYEKQLENHLRRGDDDERLVALLDERLRRTPGNPALETEVLALHAALGHDKRVQEILAARLARETEPVAFFLNVPTYRSGGVPGLKERAKKLAEQPVKPAEVAPLFNALYPLEQDDPFYRGLAAVIARRHAKHPAARAWLVSSVDRGADAPARLVRARELAEAWPDDDGYQKVWQERAAWAGDLREEVRAREAWTKRHGDDFDNRRALADLYAGLNRPRDAVVQWRAIVEKEGEGGPGALRLIDALFAVGETKQAMDWLERRAALQGASQTDRIFVADQLFGNEHFDRALRFYMAVLGEEPEHAHALLRAGQIRSWTNDPRGAIPFLNRRLGASEEKTAEVRFYLGEAHWAIRGDDEARRFHKEALDALIDRTDRTIDQDVMVAKMLVRFHRHDEAHPIFERVVAAVPDNADLVLDYADSMIASGDVKKARELVDHALELAPGKERAQRLDGVVAISEGRFEDAIVTLETVLKVHGADAGTESELGHAAELAGEWQIAADAYGRSLDLQPDNADARQTLQHLADRVADLVHARFDYSRTGDDHRLSLWFSGSLYAGKGRRFAAEIGFARHEGRADAVSGGAEDVTASVAPIHLSLFQRWERLNEIGGGLLLYPGAPGDIPVGFWLGGHLLNPSPYSLLEVRLHVHALLERPAAAAGLGGRTSGLRARYQRDVLRRFWWSAELSWELLTLDSSATGFARDGYLEGGATFGWRLREGPHRVGSRPSILSSPFPGLTGPALDSEPGETATPHISIWGTYHFIRLLDSQELATLVPIGTRFDYISVGGRVDWHVARALGVSVSGTIGRELHDGDLFFELNANATWRPEHRMELTAGVGFGTAQGRTEDTTTLALSVAFSYRW